MIAHITYRLLSVTIYGTVHSFDHPLLFVPINKRTAAIINGNGWPNEEWPIPTGEVAKINYAMSATNDKVCVTELFTHDIKRGCYLAGKIGKPHYLHGSPLFKSDAASFLLKSKELRGLKAIQFVC